MAASKFRLARVRRVRDIKEEIARSELLAAEDAFRAAEQAAQTARTRLAEALDSIERLQRRARIEPLELLNADATLLGLQRRAREARNVADVALQAAQRSRGIWMSARQDARALGQLETRASAARRAELDLRETRELEEIASNRTFLADNRTVADARRKEART